jgi:hypothetical protein
MRRWVAHIGAGGILVARRDTLGGPLHLQEHVLASTANWAAFTEL